MRKFRSHKVVEAGPIVNVGPIEGGKIRVCVIAQGAKEIVEAPASLVARGWCSAGDYLIRYPDGYISWSPGKPFEEGYTEVSPEDELTLERG